MRLMTDADLISSMYCYQKCYCGPMCDVSCCVVVPSVCGHKFKQLVETDNGHGFRIGSFGNGWKVRILT